MTISQSFICDLRRSDQDTIATSIFAANLAESFWEFTLFLASYYRPSEEDENLIQWSFYAIDSHGKLHLLLPNGDFSLSKVCEALESLSTNNFLNTIPTSQDPLATAIDLCCLNSLQSTYIFITSNYEWSSDIDKTIRRIKLVNSSQIDFKFVIVSDDKESISGLEQSNNPILYSSVRNDQQIITENHSNENDSNINLGNNKFHGNQENEKCGNYFPENHENFVEFVAEKNLGGVIHFLNSDDGFFQFFRSIAEPLVCPLKEEVLEISGHEIHMWTQPLFLPVVFTNSILSCKCHNIPVLWRHTHACRVTKKKISKSQTRIEPSLGSFISPFSLNLFSNLISHEIPNPIAKDAHNNNPFSQLNTPDIFANHKNVTTSKKTQNLIKNHKNVNPDIVSINLNKRKSIETGFFEVDDSDDIFEVSEIGEKNEKSEKFLKSLKSNQEALNQPKLIAKFRIHAPKIAGSILGGDACIAYSEGGDFHRLLNELRCANEAILASLEPSLAVGGEFFAVFPDKMAPVIHIRRVFGRMQLLRLDVSAGFLNNSLPCQAEVCTKPLLENIELVDEINPFMIYKSGI
ncbi:hypothetical protein TRFO_17913 [Tritrichomonas foetus]|uniref:Uncharacterized protein n=1 Tax=Tritrichomonas foetus TaxID=1144522 RepID=A0A1J4KLY8_9EUKA|nr:hypothetical protein TRFO_17913 [Tritrichomonas foetus]|eukprot:OHT12327.1 hypothetical protein TRFO_17913 [Tritrichomonas foetus]